MSRAKKNLFVQPESILESKLDIINKVKGETLLSVASYLRRCDIQFTYLITFLNNPYNYPGSSNGIKLIVEKFLGDVISQYYFQIQQENMQIKFVYDEIMKYIFRGKK